MLKNTAFVSHSEQQLNLNLNLNKSHAQQPNETEKECRTGEVWQRRSIIHVVDFKVR